MFVHELRFRRLFAQGSLLGQARTRLRAQSSGQHIDDLTLYLVCRFEHGDVRLELASGRQQRYDSLTEVYSIDGSLDKLQQNEVICSRIAEIRAGLAKAEVAACSCSVVGLARLAIIFLTG